MSLTQIVLEVVRLVRPLLHQSVGENVTKGGGVKGTYCKINTRKTGTRIV